ncbi:MAG: OsmC family protein [Gammaproteobacteria bacterium]|nr:OsmC family protein [Gammaproteobacteria bacterium]MCZ6772280.1 OsmC family protein [Pseudomonadota bacterium]
MNPEELKALQAPVKEQYRETPEAALITLRSESNGAEGVACKLETSKGIVEAGLHPATGGDGTQACSGDMLLEALTACAGVTLQAVATTFGVELTKSRIIAEGELDFRGTLGVAKDASVGFRDIRLTFDIDADAPVETLAKIAQLTERYCVVLQTIQQKPNIEVITAGS